MVDNVTHFRLWLIGAAMPWVSFALIFFSESGVSVVDVGLFAALASIASLAASIIAYANHEANRGKM